MKARSSSAWKMFPLPQIWHHFSRYSFPQIIIYPPVLASSRALSLTPLPLLIYSLWLAFSISLFTLHPPVHPSIHPAAQPHSSALPSSPSLKRFHIRFFRNRGVFLRVLTHTLACAREFKSSLALPSPFPSSHPLHASSMRAVTSCFIMPKHRGWKLINGTHT